MNKKIRDLDIEQVLFFDIETVRRNRELDVNSREFTNYSWSLRDTKTGFIPPAIEVKKHYEKMAALKPEYNKIVVISVGYVLGTTLYYKSIVGEQKEVIKEFYSMIKGRKLCGHNIIGFDLPVTRIKAFEEGLLSYIPEAINDCGKKPWNLEDAVLDTMHIMKGTYFYNISLENSCNLGEIPSSKDDISGAYVSQVYYEEGVDRIAKYCNKDVIAVADLFCSLQDKKGFITDYVDRGEKPLRELEDIVLLDHITISGELTPEHLKLVINQTDKEKLDRESVYDSLNAALSYKAPYNTVPIETREWIREELGLISLSQIKADKAKAKKKEKELEAQKRKEEELKKYSKISVVVDKGNLGKTEADKIIKDFSESSSEIKKEVLSLTKEFLEEKGKIKQSRAKKALEYLTENLI